MANSSLKETIDVANFAEAELKSILGEIALQNERLVDVQRKAGTTYAHLVQNSKLIDDVFRVTKPRLAIGIIIFSVCSFALVYGKIMLGS